MELPAGFSLKSLRVFNMVVESGNMTRAARNLGLTQSSVSETISLLEQSLEAELFDRQVRPIRLTTAGEQLYARTSILLQHAADAFNAVRDAGAIGLPRLTLSMIESTVNKLGPVLVSELNSLAVCWRVWSGISPDAHGALMNHAADIIVTASEELDDADGFESHRLLEENFIILAPRSWNLERLDLATLAERPFIRFSLRSAIGQKIERQINRLRLRLPFHAEFDTIGGVQSTVAGGLGWTFTTPLCLMNDPSSFDMLAAAPLKRFGFSRRVTLIGRKGTTGAAPAMLAAAGRRALRDLLARTMAGRWSWVQQEMRIPD